MKILNISLSKCLIIPIYIFLLSQIGYNDERESPLTNKFNSINNRIGNIKELIKDPNKLISEIVAAENALKNLKVESELFVEQKKTIENSWKGTPIYCSSTAWFLGHDINKIRVDVHKEVLEWRGGVDSHSEDSYSVRFDGKEGGVIFHQSGPLNKTVPMKRMKRSSNMPQRLKSGWTVTFIGSYFSFHFHFSNNKKYRSFSDVFRASFSGNPEVYKFSKITVEEFQGVPCIKIGSGNQRWGWLSYWLDPYRGFALLGYEKATMQEDGSLKIVESFRVKKLEKVATNVWYPKEAWGERPPMAENAPFTRFVYKANKIFANNPEFNEDIFKLNLPEENNFIDNAKVNNNEIGISLTNPSSIEQQIEMLRIELLNINQQLCILKSDVDRLKTQFISNKRTNSSIMNTIDPKEYNIEIGSSPYLGEKNAFVNIIIFMDYECAYCIMEYRKIKQILSDFPGIIRLIFKHFPLQFHKYAKSFHAVAELVYREKGNRAFWQFHDLVIEDPKKIEIPELRRYTESLGVDLKKFEDLIANELKMNELLKADREEAKKCNVRGTPTVFINGIKLTNRSLDGYKARINQILNN